MAPISVILGILLLALGAWGFLRDYLATGEKPYTALIPAAFGLVFVILGLLGFKDNLRKHVMHAAAALGVLGFVGALIRPAMLVPTLLAGGSVPRPMALLSQIIMAVLCLIFVLLCVQSFVAARRRRTAAPPGNSRGRREEPV